MKYLWVGIVIVGVVAIAFGAVWRTAIFPKLERIPSDFSRTDDFIGSYTVVDPLVQQVQANASIQQVRSSSTTLELLADSTIQQLLGNPATLQQLLSNPAALQQMLSNPAALQQADPATRQLLSSPAVQRLFADPAVQRLLADPAALQLLGSPATLALLADPAALPVVTVPVLLHRVRTATGAQGDRLTLNEQVTTTRADTGQELPGFPKSSVTLVIDRRDSRYLDGTEGGRTGHLGLPFNVDKNKTYPVYVSAARGPLDARYAGIETVDGLSTIVFKIDTTDHALGTHPDLKLPMVVDSHITLRAEPHSGRVVDIEDHATTVSIIHPTRGKLPIYVSDIEMTSDSVAQQIAEGKTDKSTLVWLGTLMPWTIIAVGIVLVAGGGAVMFLKRTVKQEASQPPAGPPTPA